MLPARLWRGIVDLLTPPACLACRSPLSEPASLCAACWVKLAHIEEPVCAVMGTPFAYDQGEGMLSPAALAEPPAWSRARAAVAYDDVSRPLAHGLKFHDRHEAGLLMARMMARVGRRLLASADVMVPVPLHRLRLWTRRFNQSAFLALKLSEMSGKPFRSDILLRARATPPQVGLDAAARRKNVKGAFSVAPAQGMAVAGRRVLLIDDVMTTGATANACASALRQAGASEVDVLCFALVLAPRRLHI
jgi:ComF family protein